MRSRVVGSLRIIMVAAGGVRAGFSDKAGLFLPIKLIGYSYRHR